jgi:hypothetical protein
MESLHPLVAPFAGFLAERLELNGVTVATDQMRPAALPNDIESAATADEVRTDMLPLFVETWRRGVGTSRLARALVRAAHAHPLTLVYEPPLAAWDTQIARLKRHLDKLDLSAPLVGSLPSVQGQPGGVIALVESVIQPLSPKVSPPRDFTVVAFMATYNEADIIRSSITDLFEQGVQTYVIDNWSTDGTFDIAKSMVGKGVVGLERSPLDGPPRYYDFRAILERMEDLASTVEADWFIKHDADEVRRGPWERLSLRDATYRVDAAGYNRIDFTVANFPPVDNKFQAGSDFVEYFKMFDWGHNPGHFVQQKAWKNSGQKVSLAEGASHVVDFVGARLYPYKFLVRHYPIRSQPHGERKIFVDRKPRVLPSARERGWHNHYDRYVRGQSFLVDPKGLKVFDDEFPVRYLLERLSGVGITMLPPKRAPTAGTQSSPRR